MLGSKEKEWSREKSQGQGYREQFKMAVLGCGTMSSALVIPMKRFDERLNIWTYTPSKTRAQILAKAIDGRVLEDVKNLGSFDFIFLGCKPQQLKTLCDHIGGLHSKQTIISILAGTSIATISKMLAVSSVFRMMPNMPSLIGHGVNIVSTSHNIIPEHNSYLTELFKATSKLFIVEEKDIDKITPISGSGPAFIFEWARLMEADLESLGISLHLSRNIIIHTFLGSAKLMEQSDKSFEHLREDITSLKGVTYEALEEFRKSDLAGIVERALKKARKRAYELAKHS